MNVCEERDRGNFGKTGGMDGRERRGIKTLIGGDFNARTGREERTAERVVEERSGEGINRKSRDKKVTEEGKKLVNFVEETGWSIFNGNI